MGCEEPEGYGGMCHVEGSAMCRGAGRLDPDRGNGSAGRGL